MADNTMGLYLLIGLSAGIIGGFFGIGGAIIIVPLLVFTAHFSQHLAQGTSLGALLLPIGLLAAWRYYQAGHVHIPAALAIAGGFLFGGWIGAHFAHQLDGALLRRCFGVLLTLLGVKFLLGR